MFKIFSSPEDIAKKVSELLYSTIKQKPSAALGLATGSTMEPVYAYFVKQVQETGLDLSQVTTFNLDEYIGLPFGHPQSYWAFMQQHLFEPLNIAQAQTHLPCGNAKVLTDECEQYTQKIQALGGLDIQLLGIGSNGHIGFNEPGTPFDRCTHVVDLTEETRLDNSRFFNDLSEMPTQAVTMGIAEIMSAKEVVLVATGLHKSKTMRHLYESEPDPNMPASILKTHPNVKIWLDTEAAALLPKI